jgi:FAD/FMN-containing dehydrogenase
LSGHVIGPDDGEYDSGRTVFYGGFDRRPIAIVKAADDGDVSRVVTLAAEADLELAIRSGGHSLAGHGVSDGGIVLDLSEMTALQIDPTGRTAWAQAGLTAGDYTAAAHTHGLATGFGDTGSVGIGGITLGGGIGFLTRKHGLTIDSLLAADLVTADGETHRADSENHPDLFWAIRGGGGNFGVVTRFHYRLHEVGTVVGGVLILPATPDNILSFVAAAEAAPEELTTIANVMKAPPMPFLPEGLIGRPVIFGMLVNVGPVEAGERAVAPFRGLDEPIADMVRPMPYPEIFMEEEGAEEFHPLAAARTMFIDDLDGAVAETIVGELEASTAAMAVTQIRVLGGAMAQVPVEDTAFAHRRRGMLVNVAALYESPDAAGKHEVWTDRLTAAIRRESRGAYSGFLGDEGEDRIREAYPPPTWDRLVAVKHRYDPNNLFRLNQNIPSVLPDVTDESSA